MQVQDPTVYPIVFEIDKREITIIEESGVFSTFAIENSLPILSAFYYYEDQFLLDVDPLASGVSSVGNDKRVIYEFVADSTDIETATFQAKVWTSESAFTVIDNIGHEDFRQVPWTSSATSHSFYGANSMKGFVAYEYQSVDYYPSVNVHVMFYPHYETTETLADLDVTPGSRTDIDVIAYQNFGILVMLFEYELEWYYDEGRTLVVSSPPSALPTIGVQNSSARIFFYIPGKYKQTGAISSGLASFDGVLKQSYVLSHSLDYGKLVYLGQTGDELFVELENEVLVDDNGFCIAPGKLSQTYILDGP